ncbi:hypothetical protein MKY98_26765 [Paenibacillus sp. FSL M8-0228]|jgi:hypothetical protein|uniref:hypothetical protein n=1 Tax=Paenibacillus TaxID=44249 RepID=UPI00083CB7DC|nr:hypothetical protein [Paenibacillus polymyxa]MBO3287564.1 hypothetical protein [Paenibacillus polymyxa]ODB54943.1 hypothetical protein A7311_20925 [Paenibacillus polymyxa]
MPLPFLIGGAIVAIGGLVGAAAKSVNRDYEEELVWINRKIRSLAEETNRNYNATQQDVKSKLDNWMFIKKEAHTHLLPRFVDSFGNLKQVDYDTNEVLTPDIVKDIKQTNLKYKMNHKDGDVGTESEAALKGAILGIVGGGAFLLGSVIKNVKLQYAIEEAEANLAKMKLEAEKVKTVEMKLRHLGKRAGELTSVTQVLSDLFKLALHQLECNIATYGTNYSQYDLETRKRVHMVAELAKTVKTVVSTELLNDSWEPNPKLATIIRTSREAVEKFSHGG